MKGFISPNNKVVSVLINPSSNLTPGGVTFPTQQDLENRKIVAIEAYSVRDIPFDPLNPGTPVLPDTAFVQAFLTLYTSAVNNKTNFSSRQEPGLFYDKYPLVSMRRTQNNVAAGSYPSFVQDIFLIRPTELAFNKCKIEFPNPVALATTASAVFVFHYLDKGDDGVAWMNAMGYGAQVTK